MYVCVGRGMGRGGGGAGGGGGMRRKPYTAYKLNQEISDPQYNRRPSKLEQLPQSMTYAVQSGHFGLFQ